MPGPTAKKLKKLIAIADGLFLYNGRPAAEICAALGISKKELLEAMQTLSMCGVPPYDPGSLIDAYMDEDDKVFVSHVWGLFDRPALLSRDEAASILIACRAALSTTMSDSEPLKSAVEKIRSAMKPEEAGEALNTSARVDISPESGDVLKALGALKRCAGTEKARIEYYSAGRNEFAVRVFRPYGLIYHIEQWYCVGFCELRNGLRLLRLDRIKSAVGTGEEFKVPADFSLDDYRRNTMFKMIERPHKAVILFTGAAAEYAAEKWPDRAKTLEGGGVEVSFHVDRLESFVPTVMGFGPGASVKSPDEFRKMVSTATRKTLALYT